MDIFISIGERLRTVRDEMGLSQTAFAAIAENFGVKGTTRQSQANYEKGKQMPSAAYLAAIASAGADVQYILTGMRTAGVTVSEEGKNEPDSFTVSTRNKEAGKAMTGEVSLEISGAYENCEVEEEVLTELHSSRPNCEAKEAPQPPAQPTPGEHFDRERMRTAIVCVEAGLRKRFAPAKKAEILLTCYDLLGQWEREDKAADFAKQLQAFLAATFN